MSAPLKPSQLLGDRSPAASAQPGRLLLSAARAWLLLTGAGLVAGLLWRLGGSAPPLTGVLDAAGLALWLCALWLAPAWGDLLAQPHRHLSSLPWRWTVVRRDIAWLLAVALLLALAPAAILLAFDVRAGVADFYLFDDLNLYLPLGPWVIGSLLLIGPTIVIVSLLLLHWSRALLGQQWGSVLWLLVTAAAHAPLIAGAPLWSWPTTIGGYADWLAATVAHTRIDTLFLDRLLVQLVRTPLLALLAAVFLAGLAHRPTPRPRGRVPVGWFAAVAGTVLVALRAAVLSSRWATDPGQLYPGSSTELFALGITSVCLAWWLLLALDRARPSGTEVGELAWTWYAVGAWLALTLPQLVADQADRPELLAAGVAALPIVTAGVLLLRRVLSLTPLAGGPQAGVALVLMLALLVLPWPLAGGFSTPAIAAHRWLAGALTDIGGSLESQLALAAAVLLCLLLWPWRRLKRRAAG